MHQRLTKRQVYDDGYVRIISTLSRKAKIQIDFAKSFIAHSFLLTLLNVPIIVLKIDLYCL